MAIGFVCRDSSGPRNCLCANAAGSGPYLHHPLTHSSIHYVFLLCCIYFFNSILSMKFFFIMCMYISEFSPIYLFISAISHFQLVVISGETYFSGCTPLRNLFVNEFWQNALVAWLIIGTNCPHKRKKKWVRVFGRLSNFYFWLFLSFLRLREAVVVGVVSTKQLALLNSSLVTEIPRACR